MTTTTIDWAKLQETATDLEPPPPGTYMAKCVSSRLTKARSGVDMFENRYVIHEGPQQGRSFFDNIVFTPDNPDALAFFFRKMDAFGIDLTGKSNLASLCERMTGVVVSVTLAHREYEGTTRVDVKSYARVGTFVNPTAGAPPNIPSGPPKLNWES